jgi:glucose 1-dehydrogenase
VIIIGTGAGGGTLAHRLAPSGKRILLLERGDFVPRELEVQADRINLEFVLGNKVMVGSVNASRENFETGVRDMAQAEAEYPGWLRRLLTHPVAGLHNYRELFDRLQNPDGAIKIYCEVAAQ